MSDEVANNRKQNLQRLIDSFPEAPGNRAAFCRKFGLDPLQIGHYFTASKNGRRMGEQKAREIEQKIEGLPTGWLDQAHSPLAGKVNPITPRSNSTDSGDEFFRQSATYVRLYDQAPPNIREAAEQFLELPSEKQSDAARYIRYLAESA